MTKAEAARQYFSSGFNCSQSVFAVFAPELGLSIDQSLKLASAFGAGIGRRQLSCGAVTGAVMAISLKFGKGLNDEESKKTFTYDKTVAFMEEFAKKHKSINCRELLDGLDMNSEIEKIRELGYFQNRCPLYVSDAVEIAEKLLND